MAEVSREYAAALFELAKESGQEKAFLDALQEIQAQLDAQPEYDALLSSPNLSIRQRQELLEQAFAQVPEYVLSFTELLCEKGHIQQFDACVQEYEALYRALSRISTARVVSAVALTDEEKRALVARLEKRSGHTVTAQYDIDEGILGGLIVHMDDTVIDGSLRRKLKEVEGAIDR